VLAYGHHYETYSKCTGELKIKSVTEFIKSAMSIVTGDKFLVIHRAISDIASKQSSNCKGVTGVHLVMMS